MSENRFADVEGIEDLVGQLVGAGSMMWANVDRAGIFLSTEAAKVMREGTERLSQILGEGEPAVTVDVKCSHATSLLKWRCVECGEDVS